MKSACIIISILLLTSLSARSDEKDSTLIQNRLNGISFNPTPMMLCNSLKNITFVYERMIKKDQSLVFQLGYLELKPSMLDSINHDGSVRQKTNYGINLAFQYRFYPSRLNAQPAPFGLYWGPFLSYYGMKTTSTYRLTDTGSPQYAEAQRGYNMLNLGIGVGYQFIIRDRISIDLLAFGPTITYSFKSRKTSGNLPPNEEAAISDMMQNSSVSTKGYPLLSQFIEAYGNGSSASFTTFFRYAVTFGFHF